MYHIFNENPLHQISSRDLHRVHKSTTTDAAVSLWFKEEIQDWLSFLLAMKKLVIKYLLNEVYLQKKKKKSLKIINSSYIEVLFFLLKFSETTEISNDK